ncbi:mitochondrial intermediate peptidase-like [Oppia nitens]|uniref:mitochondrial intermediate peptidase-like n=1 Tax=Oppia nitens TaxID=1686743 RepID=UPI0023DB5692|nr:mitochondrial intermediate peptidase-like [Oppia nitens]
MMNKMISKVFVRNVSTLSPLAAAFNRQNPKPQLLTRFFEQKTGLFGHQLLADASGFYLYREKAIIEVDQLVKEALSPDRRRKMVEIFDQMSNNLCRVADLAEFVRVGHPSQRFGHSAEEASIAITTEVEKLNTNKALYEMLRKVVNTGDKFATTELDEYVMKLFLFDFEQSGIHLSEDKRKLVLRLNQHILHVGSYFMSSTSQPRSVPKSKLPEEVRDCFQTQGDNIVVTGLYNESDNELVREAAYRVYLYPEEHQEKLLMELLMSRLKLAQICGFKSYSQRAINGSIAQTPETVWLLIDSITDRLRPLAEKDFQTMLSLKNISNKYAKSVKLWDVPYFTYQYKQKKFSQNINQCFPYFSLGCCMDGLNLIFGSIFSVKLEICEQIPGENWYSNVIKLAVIDTQTNETLGHIYCDFYERSAKPHNDCHFTIQGGCRLSDGSYQLPIVVLSLNLPNPTPATPSLLTPHMVDNLFHEMGHAMHSMMARTPYQHITGTRCSTDLAEVPSILMEYFASDRRVIKAFARHYQTGQPVPDSLLDIWLDSKRIFTASELQCQVFYAALDQSYHSSDPLRGHKNTTEVLAQIQNHYYSLPHVTNTSWQLRFAHLVGYGAKYYSYLVSKSVAASIWQKLFLKDPLSSSAGQLFKDQVLSHGGGNPPKLIVENILQQTISAKGLADSLIDNVFNSYEDITNSNN